MDPNNNNEEIDLSDTLQNTDNSVKFQDEQRISVPVFYPGTSKIIRWLIKYSGGTIKDEKQANYVLIGIAVIAITITIFLIFNKNFDPSLDQKAMNEMLKLHPELINQ
ncbi:MAG: hypothetical protein US76_04365 [Parcubacteria group bacterium GW2011_GWA2_38_13b]|nr:MAG: hypothetical protein US76_04365 [Parcubacteria group bacterium GW2011_GWA2_38_13b]